MICDSWYIGAFGRWWRGGIIEAWYHDVIAKSKDEEIWSSGILTMKNLDLLNDYNGLLQKFVEWSVKLTESSRTAIFDKKSPASSPVPRIPSETQEPREIVATTSLTTA